MRLFIPPRLRKPVGIAVAGAAFAAAWLVRGGSLWWVSILAVILAAARAVSWYQMGGKDTDEGALARSQADERQQLLSLRSRALACNLAVVAAFVGLTFGDRGQGRLWWPGSWSSSPLRASGTCSACRTTVSPRRTRRAMTRTLAAGAAPDQTMRELEMTTQQLNLLAVVSIAVCWCAGGGSPGLWLRITTRGGLLAERTRSWSGTAVVPGVIIVTAISFALPKADWRSLTFYIPSARILGLGDPAGRDGVYYLGPARARRHVERCAHSQGEARASHHRAVR